MQSDRIIATASQKVCLFRLFPIIFNDVIDRLPSMIVYRQLWEIVDLVFSMPFRKRWLPVLQDLCVAFHRSMIIHFPQKLVPKMHFLCEYARMIEDYGPLRRQWSFRYEAAHAYFKKVVMPSNNFKNVSKMLAKRFAFKQAAHKPRSWVIDDTCNPVGIRKIQSNTFHKQIKQVLIHHFDAIDFQEDLVQCNKLFYHNNEYRCSSVYVLGVDGRDDKPIFGQISRIVKRSEKWWLIIDVLRTSSYDETICAWELKSHDMFSIYDPFELKYFYKSLDFYALNSCT